MRGGRTTGRQSSPLNIRWVRGFGFNGGTVENALQQQDGRPRDQGSREVRSKRNGRRAGNALGASSKAPLPTIAEFSVPRAFSDKPIRGASVNRLRFGRPASGEVIAAERARYRVIGPVGSGEQIRSRTFCPEPRKRPTSRLGNPRFGERANKIFQEIAAEMAGKPQVRWIEGTPIGCAQNGAAATLRAAPNRLQAEDCRAVHRQASARSCKGSKFRTRCEGRRRAMPQTTRVRPSVTRRQSGGRAAARSAWSSRAGKYFEDVGAWDVRGAA